MPAPLTPESTPQAAPPAPVNENDWQSSFTNAQQNSAPAPSIDPPQASSSQMMPAEPPSPDPAGAAPAFTPAPEPNPLFDQARELGLEFDDGATPDQIAQAAMERLQHLNPYAEYGQSVLPYAGQFQEYLANQNRPPEPQPAQPEADEWTPEAYFQEQWKSPEWIPQYQAAIERGMVQRDDYGNYVAAPGMEVLVAPILAGLNEADSFQREKWQSLMRGNPYQNFYEALREPLQRSWMEDVKAEIARQLGETQVQQNVRGFEAENASWLYTTDKTGQTILTERGIEFRDTIQMLRESGVQDQEQLLKIASKMVPPPQPEQPPAPAAQAPPPATNGHATPAAEKQQSFIENALERAQHTPQTGGSGSVTPDDPGTISQPELNNLFVRKFRAERAQPAA